MRVAQVAPLAESIPPRLYGGTERVIAWFTDALVECGYEVTLCATGDSSTQGTLVPVWPRALRLGRPQSDPIVAQAAAMELVTGRIFHCLTRLGGAVSNDLARPPRPSRIIGANRHDSPRVLCVHIE
jgi:hypothetical protein